jgi:predicted nucleic acid-binding protein
MKILLDNNAIDKIRDNMEFMKCHPEITFYICKEVADEVIADSQTYSPTLNLQSLEKVNVSYEKNAIFILGHSKLDSESTFCDSETLLVYNSILKETKSNIKDATIAATAVKNGCTLITYDKGFYRKMKRFGYSVTTFEELIEQSK